MTSAEAQEAVYLVGGSPEIQAQLGAAMGREVQLGYPPDPQETDWIFLDAVAADPGAIPIGNAFSACRALKEIPARRVFLLVDAADKYAAEIARFCLADGCLAMRSDRRAIDLEPLQEFISAKDRSHASIDLLLASLEREIAGNESRQASALQRLLHEEPAGTLLGQLTEPETGLFDGPFASFKLDEELKRALRFHQPLSVILLDCGLNRMPEDPTDRKTMFAEMASLFLNECRDIDVLARFTETVFMFLLPGTGTSGASHVARRMLDGLRAREFVVPVKLDPAVGIATVPMSGIRDRKEFLARAEACLQLARQGQGDRGLCCAMP